jgi:hypothetical protein
MNQFKKFNKGRISMQKKQISGHLKKGDRWPAVPLANSQGPVLVSIL